MPECTCRGLNPKCFKCGGWGWIGDEIGDHASELDDPFLPPSQGKPQQKAKPTTREPKTEKIPTPLRQVIESIVRFPYCPYCDKKFNVYCLDHHVSRYHIDKWEEYSKKPEVIKRLKIALLQRCEKCGDLVKNLSKHVKVHSRGYKYSYTPPKRKKPTE